MLGPFTACERQSARGTPENHSKNGLSNSEIRIFVLNLTLSGLLFASVLCVEARAQALPKVPRAPVTVLDEVEHLPAPSWKVIPLSLPYGGNLRIDVQVVRGNPIEVLLIRPDQLERIKRGEWNKIRALGGMRATHTRSYQQAGTVSRGEYYLVVGDRYLGEPPSPPTEVAVKVHLSLDTH